MNTRSSLDLSVGTTRARTRAGRRLLAAGSAAAIALSALIAAPEPTTQAATLPVDAISPYTVIDLSEGLAAPSAEFGLADMNNARQATGRVNGLAFRHDGSTSSYIFPTVNNSIGSAINAGGTVAGSGTNGGRTEAFRYDGAVQFLGTLGGDESLGADINDVGDVIGIAKLASGERHAFLYRDGAMIDLHTLGGETSSATRINQAGLIIGNYDLGFGQYRGFVSNGTVTTDLGTLAGMSTAPNALNESGVITGSSGETAFRYSAGTMTSIAPPGSTSSDGRAINESGAIAGSFVDGSGIRRGFVLDDGSFTTIPDMGGTFAVALDINESGEVVGMASSADGSTRGFLFANGVLVDLTALLPPGYDAVIRVARNIADDGSILVRGEGSNGSDRALILVPPNPHTAPGAPTDVLAAEENAAASVTWTAPADDGGSPITGYNVTASPGGATASASATATSATVNGLANGTTYTFTVAATNALGTGQSSGPSAPVTPPGSATTVPSAPTSVTAAAGDAQGSVSWAQPATDGGTPITSYTVTASAGGASTSVAGNVTTATVNGLTNGTPYTFTVTATNAVGTGAPSNPSAAVTPQAGAPVPQTTQQTISRSGGSATTDSTNGPTPSDPVTTTVIIPATSEGGSVTIAETAITATPPGGYQFVGQQININSTAPTSPSNPLTIVFTIDSSALRAAYGLAPGDLLPAADQVDVTRAEGIGSPSIIAACSAVSPLIDPDPCITTRGYINSGDDLQITVLTGMASYWDMAIKPVAVTVTDSGYSPKAPTVALGGTVVWTFAGSKLHSATDNLKLGPAKAPLFSSGQLVTGRYGYVFRAAGTYTYASTVKGDPGSFAGSIGVPVRVSQTAGGTTTSFTVTWSSSALPGYVFDVQYRFMKEGSKIWSGYKSWKTGVSTPSAGFVPPSGRGTYAFGARLRNATTGMASLWSPEVSIVVR